MERKKASDFDPQLLALFHRYVHGHISRRERAIDHFNQTLNS